MRDDSLEYAAQQASKGNGECFVLLCNALKERLFYTAKGILGDESLALDAVSEAVYRAYKGIKRLREPRYAGTWFTRILLNVSTARRFHIHLSIPQMWDLVVPNRMDLDELAQ